MHSVIDIFHTFFTIILSFDISLSLNSFIFFPLKGTPPFIIFLYWWVPYIFSHLLYYLLVTTNYSAKISKF